MKRILLGLLMVFCSGALAQELVLGFAHVDPADWTISKKGAAALTFKNIVEGESGGRIVVELFDSGSLGGETDLVQSVQDGTLEMTMISGAMSQVCPEAAVLDIPYIFSSAAIAWQVIDGSFGEALAQHCLETTGLRTLAYGETGFRNFTNSVRPIRTPADLEGLSIRVQNTPLFVNLIESLGGEPTPLAFSELPTALATGVVDGQENPVSVIYSNNLYEVQDYLTLDGHVYAADFMVISDDVYQSLSAADQALLKRAAVVAGSVGRSIQQFNSADGVARLIEAGMEVYTPTAEELAQFRAASQPAIIEYLREEIDSQWIEDLQAAVAEAEANF